MTTDMYKGIIEAYYKESDGETYWFVKHDENMVVIADRVNTTCDLYETAQACCEEHLFPHIEDVYDQEDLKYVFSQEQVDFINKHCRIVPVF